MSKHLESELSRLRGKLLDLSTLVVEVVQKSVKAFEDKDKDLAKEVIQLDDEIDRMEVEVEEDCLKILALHQPVAIDLRYLIGVLKMNNDLERIGDLAVNVAERVLHILKYPAIKRPISLHDMGEKSIKMLNDSIQALIHMDTDLARQVCFADDEVDQMNRDMYKVIYELMKKNPDQVESLNNHLSCSRHLERIADYTTNIAEDVIYMVDGTIVRHSPDIYE